MTTVLNANMEKSIFASAMKSIGCVEEGVLRGNYSTPTGRGDSIVLSIYKEEWNGQKRKELEAKVKSGN